MSAFVGQRSSRRDPAHHRQGCRVSGLINPEPLDDELIAGLMTTKPYLRWYEIRAWLKWRIALWKWKRKHR